MGIEIFITIAAGVLSMAAGGVASSKEIQMLFRRLFKIPETEQTSYSERLSQLTKKLDEASNDVDDVLKEIAEVADNRQKTVDALEHDLGQLEAKETHLKEKITALENTPVEAAKHFAALVSEGEKRGAKRDYLLFGAGVLVSTAVAVVFQFLVV